MRLRLLLVHKRRSMYIVLLLLPALVCVIIIVLLFGSLFRLLCMQPYVCIRDMFVCVPRERSEKSEALCKLSSADAMKFKWAARQDRQPPALGAGFLSRTCLSGQKSRQFG